MLDLKLGGQAFKELLASCSEAEVTWFFVEGSEADCFDAIL